MIQVDRTKDEIIEFRASGRIQKVDVDDVARRLDEALGQGKMVHVYAEVLHFDGMDWQAWLSDLRAVPHYLNHLKQFGRLAIVSDDRLIRAATKIESALLPYVHYEVFSSDERDRALAWVRGEIDTPHPDGLHLLEGEAGGICGFEINGRISQVAARTVLDQLTERVSRGDDKLLAIIRHYDGFEPALWVDAHVVERKLTLLRHVTRYAIVGGPPWMDRVARAFNPLMKMDIRHFAVGDVEAARFWLSDGAAPRAG